MVCTYRLHTWFCGCGLLQSKLSGETTVRVGLVVKVYVLALW